MAVPGLFIRVYLSAKEFIAGTTLIRTHLNLLKSAFRAVFRTAIVAGFFLVLRSIFMTFSGLKNKIVSVTKSMAELNLAGLRTATVMSKGGSATAAMFNVLSKQARLLSTQVSYTAKQIQEGFFTAAIAGYNLADSMKVSISAMRLAELGGMAFGDTINSLIGIVNAFHINLSKLPRIANAISGAFTNSKMTLSDFFTSMKYVSASVVAVFGASTRTFLDTAAALMTMQDAGLDACYDDKTDVLTYDGWKNWTEVSKEDKFATVNSDTHAIEYQRATQLIKHKYNGDLYLFQSRYVDLAVTPNHRMYVRKRGKENFEIIQASDLCMKDKEFLVVGKNAQSLTPYTCHSDFKSHSTHFKRNKNPRKHYNEDKIKYNGFTYCAEVPNGLLIVRRNGKISVCGNSKAGVYLRGSLLKLQGSTSKVLNTLALYGANIYETTAASQQYFKTILSGQSALGTYYDQLNKLKQVQLDLVIAGKMGSAQYDVVTAKLGAVQQKVTALKSGLGDVFTQFTQAGGKLKPLSEVLDILGRSIPVEVLGKAFGVRGGVGIMVLLNNLAKMKEHRQTLEEVNRKYTEGQEILTSMFGKIMDSYMKKWAMLGNSIMGIFSVIFDALEKPATALIDSLLKGFTQVLKFVERNKSLFRMIFDDMAKGLQPIIDTFSKTLPDLVYKLGRIFSRQDFMTPIFGVTDKGGVGQVGEAATPGSAKPLEKIGALIQSIGSLVSAYVKVLITELQPVINFFATLFVTVLITQLKAQKDLFVSIGKTIAKSVYGYLKDNKAKIYKIVKGWGTKFVDTIVDNGPKLEALMVVLASVLATTFVALLMGMIPSIAELIWHGGGRSKKQLLAAAEKKLKGEDQKLSPLETIAAFTPIGGVKFQHETLKNLLETVTDSPKMAELVGLAEGAKKKVKESMDWFKDQILDLEKELFDTKQSF